MPNFAYNFAGGGAIVADSITVTGAVTGATVVATTSVSTPTLTTSGTVISMASGKVLRTDNGTAGAPGFEVGTSGVGIYGVGGIAVVAAASNAFAQWSSGGWEFINFAPVINKGIRFKNQTAPSAPADNSAIVYGVDNAGKDRVAALFATGAAQAIATEP